MEYEGIVIRPPSEAESLILQVTLGCSHNQCTFCPTYKGRRFRIKDPELIEKEIDEVAPYGPFRKVFLADGDALIIPQPKLLSILEYLNKKVSGLRRVGIYGNAKSILRKSVEELKALKERKLGIVYLGVETGDPALLEKIRKGATREQMVEAGRKIKEAGITLSATVLLGLGGLEAGQRHALATATILSDIDPDFASALTLMVVPGTPLHEEMKAGQFQLPSPFELLKELGTIVAHSNFSRCYFTSNHASNYLPIKARMPKDKEAVVKLIQKVVSSEDRSLLRPEFLRGL
ncbi:MAG TPA: radical SAM protein [Thermodesulfobacteriota bacterium]|nr:radical SAM protein [Thermodesulfobacteriota bacterium]